MSKFSLILKSYCRSTNVNFNKWKYFSSSSINFIENKAFDIRGTLNSASIANNDSIVGLYAEIDFVFEKNDVEIFATLCGDNNPIHLDEKYAATTPFKGTIVHGILLSSLFSSLFGRSVHGAIYASQTLSFKKPVLVGQNIRAKVEITSAEEKKSRGWLAKCSTKIYLKDTDEIAVDGEGKIIVPKYS